MPWSLPLLLLVRLLIGAHARWVGSSPSERCRVYFANHTSHFDTLAVWAALPEPVRRRTRPLAARDYWDHPPWRRRIALHGFNALLVDRSPKSHATHPLQEMIEALQSGESLILFPEGTRGSGVLPGAFKSGLFHLARRFPEVELIPVYLENLQRSLPKGTWFPVPVVCTVRFGAPLPNRLDEPKEQFLARARQAVVDLS